MATESFEPGVKPIATAKRRAVWALLLVLSTLLVLLLLAPHMIEKSGFKAHVLERLGTSTGLKFQADGPLQLRTLPGGQISLTGVHAESKDTAISIKAGKVTSDFDILPLLAGKVKVATISFYDAEMHLRIAAGTVLHANEPSPLAALIAATVSSGSSDRPPASVSCIRCTVRIAGLGAEDVVLQAFNGRWNWAGGASRASVTAEFKWRGEPVDVSFAADNLEDLRNGLPTRVVSDFTAKPAKFSFDGQSNLATNLFAEGKIAFETASLKEFIAWSEPGATVGESIDALSLAANLNAREGKMLFSDMTLTTAGAPATGVFELDMTGAAPKTSGTLAFESVELLSLLKSLPISFDRGAHLSQLDKIDLDLRLSAKTAKFGTYEIANAAGAVKIREGSADLDLGTSEFGGGTVQSHLSIEDGGQSKTGKFLLSVRGVNAESLTMAQSGTPVLAAPVNIKVEASGPYTSAISFLDRAVGSIGIEVSNGVIRNFSMDAFLKNVAEGSGFDLSDTYAGMSDIAKAEVVGRVRDGLILVDSASISASGTDMRLVGIIPLADRGFGLTGQIMGSAYTEPNSSFFVGGSWNRPVVTTGPSKSQ